MKLCELNAQNRYSIPTSTAGRLYINNFDTHSTDMIQIF